MIKRKGDIETTWRRRVENKENLDDEAERLGQAYLQQKELNDAKFADLKV